MADYSGLFYDKYKYPDELMGNRQVEEPAIIEFLNARLAGKILLTHMKNDGRIALHTDVDMDGVGSCYELKNWVRQVAPFCTVDCYINSEKVHGVEGKHISHFNSNNYDCVVILDASSNDTEFIMNLQCDCVVIDHHDVKKENEHLLSGKTVGGEYAVVNSTIDNPGLHEGTKMMSAGLVVYEFLRFVQHVCGLPDLLNALKLYQWATITLFTDAIVNDNLRNIYYITKTRSDMDKEAGLSQMLTSVGSNSMFLCKSDIGFTLSPLFNKAIRAGDSAYALQIALTSPAQANELKVYNEIQKQQVADFDIGAEVKETYVRKDITGSHVHPNYAGLVAMKLQDKYGKSAIVYRKIDNGLIKGSFRGAKDNILYNEILQKKGYFAQGHAGAFGFEFPEDKVDEIMTELMEEEKNSDTRIYLTAGDTEPGIHHVADIVDFQSKGYLLKIGTINSIMAENLNIVINSGELEFVRTNSKGTYYEYTFYGISLKAFEEIVTSKADIYVEYQDSLKLYVKNRFVD